MAEQWRAASWKRILKYFLIGVLAAVGGMFWSDIAGSLFNGMDYGSAVNLGIGMYLCVVVITCTGIIVSHLDKNKVKRTDMLEKMDDFFAARLAGYDQHMRTDIEGAKEFYPYTASLLPEQGGARVLDLGCGTGLELEEYFQRNREADVTGIDLSLPMLEQLRKKFPDRKIELIHGSYFDVPFGENRFDAAVSVESLHHFPARQKEMLYRKLHTALKPGGSFVLTDYFAESEALEKEYFADLERLKREQGISDGGFYHYDTPLTVRHETEVLLRAGFAEAEICNSWGATCTLIAKK